MSGSPSRSGAALCGARASLAPGAGGRWGRISVRDLRDAAPGAAWGFALAAALLSAAPAAAQQPVTVTIRPHASSVAVGGIVNVDVVVTSSEGDPEYVGSLPVQGLTVVGSSRRQSMEFSIGSGGTIHRVHITTTYSLRADVPGTAVVGPVVVQVGGRRYTSGTARIQVFGGPGAPGIPSTGPSPGPSGPTITPIPPTSPQPPPSPPGEGCRHPDGASMRAGDSDGPVTCSRPEPRLFLEVQVTDTRVYLGEPLRMQMRIYVERDLVGFSIGSLFSQILQREPALEGFMRTNLEPTQIETSLARFNGRLYVFATLRDKLLYPTRAGTLEIGAATGSLTLRSFFDTEEVRRESSRIPIEVLALPEHGRPAGFSPNNVARDLAVDARFGAAEVRAGEPVTLDVTLSGKGNLAGFRVDPPQVAGGNATKGTDRVEEPTPDSLVSRRTIRFTYLPSQVGAADIGGVEIPYFDYGAGEYRVARSKPLTLAVLPGSGQPAAAAVASSTGDEAPTAQGPTASIRLVNDLGSVPDPLHRSWIFWVLLLGPPAVLAGLHVGSGAAALVRRRRGQIRPRDLYRRGEDTLRRIAKGKGDGSPAAQFGAVEDALMAYLEARVGAALRGYTSDDLRRRLIGAGFAETLVTNLTALTESCNFGRFAPAEGQAPGAAEAARDGLRLLRGLGAARLPAQGRGAAQ